MKRTRSMAWKIPGPASPALGGSRGGPKCCRPRFRHNAQDGFNFGFGVPTASQVHGQQGSLGLQTHHQIVGGNSRVLPPAIGHRDKNGCNCSNALIPANSASQASPSLGGKNPNEAVGPRSLNIWSMRLMRQREEGRSAAHTNQVGAAFGNFEIVGHAHGKNVKRWSARPPPDGFKHLLGLFKDRTSVFGIFRGGHAHQAANPNVGVLLGDDFNQWTLGSRRAAFCFSPATLT